MSSYGWLVAVLGEIASQFVSYLEEFLVSGTPVEDLLYEDLLVWVRKLKANTREA